jgi:hypothetical protein
MDYYQEVVTEYLRSDRATFVNTECLIQLEPGQMLGKGAHWYCDAMAVNFRESTLYLRYRHAVAVTAVPSGRLPVRSQRAAVLLDTAQGTCCSAYSSP